MNEQANIAVLEARQGMLHVWMTLSAVWVVFWLIIAGFGVALFKLHDPLTLQFGLFLFIVATPPFALLAVGAVTRLAYETVTLRERDR